VDLEEALSQIAEIRQQVARTEWFRGYRAAPVAFSGLLAFVTAGLQPWLVPDPVGDLRAYLALWVGAAVLSLAATAWEMALSLRGPLGAVRRQQTFLAVTQFAPCLGVGALLAAVIVRWAPQAVALLPGLWSMLFGLGVFASWRFLPRATVWVGLFYVTAGAATLALAQDGLALAPWAMGVPFGVGQLLSAAVLYWTLERNDGPV
jgi:hypothetical protein